MRNAPFEITKYPEYAKAYAKRHNIPPKIIIENPLLNYAALLENKVRFLNMTITEARYSLLKQFPTMKVRGKKVSLNCIPSSGELIGIHGYSFRTSVIDLVRPLKDCLWGSPNFKSFESRRKQYVEQDDCS